MSPIHKEIAKNWVIAICLGLVSVVMFYVFITASVNAI